MARSVSPERLVVIPHGANTREHPLPPPSDQAVLLFGRLEPYKGVPVLLEAMKIVWNDRPGVKLLVSGKGPESRWLEPDPRIEASIGYVPEAMLESLFGRASLVVLPYTEASQSGVGLRALGRGVPVVVTDVGSLPDLALDPTFVVRAGDPSSLAAGLLRHLDHGPELRNRVLRFVRDYFSWDVVARETLRTYESVIASRTPELRQS
jgi:glycosyltransferase involved in cell wall biosynthesis